MESEWRADVPAVDRAGAAFGAGEQGVPWLVDLAEGAEFNERLGFVFVAWALAMFFVFHLGGFLSLSLQEARTESQLSKLRQESFEIVEARSEARGIRSLNASLWGWLSSPSQVSLIAEFDKVMSAQSKMQRWSFKDRQLEVQIFDANLDNRAYVESLEKTSVFSNIRIVPGAARNTAVISMVVNDE